MWQRHWGNDRAHREAMSAEAGPEQNEGRAERAKWHRGVQGLTDSVLRALGLCVDLAVLFFHKDCFGSWLGSRLGDERRSRKTRTLSQVYGRDSGMDCGHGRAGGEMAGEGLILAQVRGRQDSRPGFPVRPDERECWLVTGKTGRGTDQSRIRFSSGKLCDACWTFNWTRQGDPELTMSGIQDGSRGWCTMCRAVKLPQPCLVGWASQPYWEGNSRCRATRSFQPRRTWQDPFGGGQSSDLCMALTWELTLLWIKQVGLLWTKSGDHLRSRCSNSYLSIKNLLLKF